MYIEPIGGRAHTNFLKKFRPQMPLSAILCTKLKFCILICGVVIAFYRVFFNGILWAWQWSDSPISNINLLRINNYKNIAHSFKKRLF